LFPGALPEKYQDLFDGTAAVVLSLTGAELPEEYRNVHPNARVMTWYAEEIAAFLAAKGLIPGELREPTARQDQGAAKPSETPDVRVAPEETILPGGAFLMGCSPEDEDCEADERPARVVRLSPFAIERKEVTNDAYRRCVQAGACTEPRWKNWYRAKPGDHPVVGVTQPQAEAYCAWAGKSLPTEAQWEYATRAGGTARAYGPPDATAWFYRNSDRSTHPVAQKTPNAWGLYDLYGNAWEWVQDQYSRTFSTGADVVDPVNTGRNEQLIVRGGGWFTHDRYLRASYRSARYSTTFSSAEIGFRCVRNVNPATGR
jgi:formylglycine-generating enzyme required for sulfatase activity